MKYRSEIIGRGAQAAEFARENMLVLFAEDVPASLQEYCVIHRNDRELLKIEVGDTLAIGGHRYEITCIGPLAQQYLEELGHVSLCFDGADTPKMENCIHLSGGPIHIPEPGEEIVIY